MGNEFLFWNSIELIKAYKSKLISPVPSCMYKTWPSQQHLDENGYAERPRQTPNSEHVDP